MTTKFNEEKLQRLVQEADAKHLVVREMFDKQQAAKVRLGDAKGKAIALRNAGRTGEAEKRWGPKIERLQQEYEEATRKYEAASAAARVRRQIAARLQEYARKHLGLARDRSSWNVVGGSE